MTKTEQIDKVLRHFDFATMHHYMVETGWLWYVGGSLSDNRVPTYQELQREARSLLEQTAASLEEWTTAECGGFLIIKSPHGLDLHFSICHGYSTESEE